jgi:aryl-alcohol dehydrogenase-like predicted oxidoreductase
VLGAEAANLPELALRFTLSHDGVSSVIPGMRSIKHVTANLSCSDDRRLAAETLAKLKAFALDRTGEW